MDKHYLATIVERRDLAEDLWLIRVDPGGPFKFLAGQYATLGVENGDKRIERAYSIVSSPYTAAIIASSSGDHSGVCIAMPRPAESRSAPNVAHDGVE